MKHAWFWVTVWLILAAGGAAFLSVMMRQLWGTVSLALSLPICGAWGGACVFIGYRLIRRYLGGQE